MLFGRRNPATFPPLLIGGVKRVKAVEVDHQCPVASNPRCEIQRWDSRIQNRLTRLYRRFTGANPDLRTMDGKINLPESSALSESKALAWPITPDGIRLGMNLLSLEQMLFGQGNLATFLPFSKDWAARAANIC
jgi:hypothetical protein